MSSPSIHFKFKLVCSSFVKLTNKLQLGKIFYNGSNTLMSQVYHRERVKSGCQLGFSINSSKIKFFSHFFTNTFYLLSLPVCPAMTTRTDAGINSAFPYKVTINFLHGCAQTIIIIISLENLFLKKFKLANWTELKSLSLKKLVCCKLKVAVV